MVLAAASLEFSVSLLFMDDGVFQLICPKESDLSTLLTALPVYDVEKIYVAEESLRQRKLSSSQLTIPVTSLLRHEIVSLFRNHNVVFS
jgi:tRNA 2-thiouridine synthesizing protein C